MNQHSDLFDNIEESLGIHLPLYLKNILKYSGYDNRLSLANITEADIRDIEAFARSSLMIHLKDKKVKNYEDFYHIFSDNIENFMILPGHQKLIMAIGTMLAEKINEEKLKNASQKQTNQAAKKRKLCQVASTSVASEMPGDGIVQIKTENIHLDINAQQESKYLKQYCTQSIRKLQEVLPETKKLQIEDNLQYLEINISRSCVDGVVCFGYVKCPICRTEVKVQKQIRGEGKAACWLIWDFCKHFKNHF